MEARSGHYISEARDPLNKNNWIRFDDSRLSETKQADVLTGAASTGYLLFYEYQGLDS